MRAPSQAAASRPSGFGPRQTMSALSVKTGPAPSSGSAAFSPPPVSSRSGSRATSGLGRGAARDAPRAGRHGRGRSRRSGPRRRSRTRSSAWSISARPPTVQQRLRPVAGQRAHARCRGRRRRSSRPAASLRGAGGGLQDRLGRRQAAGDPGRERRELGVGEVALQMRPDPRQVAQVAGLAVAPGEPQEEAEDLQVALRGERVGGAQEGAAVGARCARGSGRASRRAARGRCRGGRPRAARPRRRRGGRPAGPGSRAGRRGRGRRGRAAR